MQLSELIKNGQLFEGVKKDETKELKGEIKRLKAIVLSLDEEIIKLKEEIIVSKKEQIALIQQSRICYEENDSLIALLSRIKSAKTDKELKSILSSLHLENTIIQYMQ